MIPITIFPFTFNFARTAIRIIPMIVTTGGITAFHAAAGVSAPEIAPWKSKICTSVYLFACTRPEPFKPTNAMNKPIPAGIDFFRHSGMAVAMYLRSPVTDRIRNTIPDNRMITRPD